ncbi:MAG: serine/threonine-protein kinase [Polyangiaceae bacterium]
MEGRLISDRYRLISLLGKGGMGSVYLAEHTTLKTELAVKLIDSELGKLPQPRARFLREAQLAARIKSSHVVQVYDHGVTDDGQPYIAMERLVGESLRERLQERDRLSRGETAQVVSHVCRALARAHEAGLVHRDLKPENIFMAKDGEGEIVKVLDFGVAKATDALSDSSIDPTRTGALLGTPYYMSPEQAQGLKSVDYRTDLWAMGVVVYECLTGFRPFSAEALGPLIGKILAGSIPPPSLAAPDAKLPPEIDAWMVKALARDPNARFGSAKELAESFMVAAGTQESLGRDGSSRDVNAAARPRTGVSPDSFGDTIGTSTLPLDNLGGTLVMAPAQPAPAPAPALAPAPAPARSPLPWILAVVVLGILVAGMTLVLVLRR